jgi:ABC-type glycerol-3-phosphate transport system substrate-binding protein
MVKKSFLLFSATLFWLIATLSTLSFCGMSCQKAPAETPRQQNKGDSTALSDTTLLFVGNSLTYSHNMPQMVADFAKTYGRHIKTETLALPNYALVDHLADGKVQGMIASKKYKFVIVQQGPSSQTEGRTLLLEAAPVFKKMCNDNGAELAFYMVWPAYEHYRNFNGVIRNYTDAATLNNAILCPVGTVWKEYIDRTGDLSYYDSDLFHPSVKGSQVAAEVIYKALFK